VTAARLAHTIPAHVGERNRPNLVTEAQGRVVVEWRTPREGLLETGSVPGVEQAARAGSVKFEVSHQQEEL
jgi:hypothetical protein